MILKEHVKWLKSQSYEPGTFREICQCGSEKAIHKSSLPERFRAELLSYVFLDQFIYTHYLKSHSIFKYEYPGPKLRGHVSGGHTSPSWFIYSTHGYDSNRDWELIRLTLSDYLIGGLEWLHQQPHVDTDKYWHLAEEEIKREFEAKHQSKLMSVVKNTL